MDRFLAVALLLLISLDVISGSSLFVPKVNHIEPTLIEIPSDGRIPLPLARDRRAPGTNSNVSHIGVTATLAGDNHRFALVHWTGYPSNNIFIVTKKIVSPANETFLWRSTDYGRTFVNETSKLPSDAIVDWFYVSEDFNKLIFVDKVHNRFYVTINEGINYTTSNLDFKPNVLRFSHSNSSNPDYVLVIDSNNSLHVSTNLGMTGTWSRLSTGVINAHWTYLTEGQTFDDPSTIYFADPIVKRAVAPYTSSDIQVFDSNLGNVLTFDIHYEYLFAVKTSETGVSALYISHMRKPFTQARFPLDLGEEKYTVVDASEGQVFLAVRHSGGTSNLYLSEEEGIFFSLSLEDVVYKNGRYDVHVVEGIKGTYMANIVVPGESYGTTVISFDKGGEWVPVTAPTLSQQGTPLNCLPPDCSLHLHMDSSASNGISGILSRESAVGLIMAQGNTGSYLTNSTMRVYFSRDGGFTWQELFVGYYVFQFLDSGSIVTAVRKYFDTSVVEYSCDDGVTWQTYRIFNNSEASIKIVGLLTEIGERAVHVTAFGVTSFYRFNDWYVIDLDFSLLEMDKCGPDNYTTWIPTDERFGSRCLLGEKILYERRIPGQCCTNGPEYDRPINSTKCECAIEDFECDFGFEHVGIDAVCSPMRGFNPETVPIHCVEGDYYNVSSGYRLIAGDTCVAHGGSYYFPRSFPCPVLAPAELYIVQDISHFGTGEVVQFTLSQLIGSKLNTNYTWFWGDDSPNNTFTSYDVGRAQNHSYALPGYYTIIVFVVNEGGSALVERDIIVLDPIKEVNIAGPDLVLADTTALFSANIVATHGTEFYTPVSYQWAFSDGSTSRATGASASHVFHELKNFTVACTVRNSVGIVIGTVIVSVKKAVSRVGIVGPTIAATQSSVNFSIKISEDEIMPDDTVFTWTSSYHSTGAVVTYTTGSDLLTYSPVFTVSGTYEVTVLGVYFAGSGSFTASFTITVRNKLKDIRTDNFPVIKKNTEENLLIYLDDINNQLYTDSVNLTIVADVSDNGAFNMYYDNSPKVIHSHLLFSIQGSHLVTVTADNDVSIVTKTFTVMVVVPNATLILSFDTNVLKKAVDTKYMDTLWRQQLAALVDNQLTSGLNLAKWQLFIATPQVIANRVDVYVDVLPTTQSDANIKIATTIANRILEVVVQDTYQFPLPDSDSSVSVARAMLAEPVIYAPADGSNSKNTLAIGIGVGIGMALLVAVVICVVGIVYYYRKYRHLQVRYSRLSQHDSVQYSQLDQPGGSSPPESNNEEVYDLTSRDEM